MKPIHYAIATIGGRWYAVVCALPDAREDVVTRELARVTCPECLARLSAISGGGA